MNLSRDRRTENRHFSIATAIALSLLLIPLVTRAEQAGAASCNALVSLGKYLYLASPTGKVLARFPSGGEDAQFVTVSPDGSKVAYASVAGTRAKSTFTVVSADGKRHSFPLFPSSVNIYNSESIGKWGPLEDMRWSTNDVLRMTKHVNRVVSRTASFFAFRRINENSGSPPRGIATNFGDGCVLRPGTSDAVACVFDHSDVNLGSGDAWLVNSGIFYQSPVTDVAPTASFKLSKGQTATTPGQSPLRVRVLSIDNGTVSIRVIFSNGNWVGGNLEKGDFTKVSGINNDYYFFATILDAATGLVRVDEVKVPVGAPLPSLDPALAWQPDGKGLLLIQHTQDNQGTLYLIKPQGKPGQWKWQLVATAPIDIPVVQNMRFAGPTSLLLQTGDDFSEVPIHITSGSKHGRPTITLGTVTPMPTIATVTVKGTSTEGEVLDWSCGDNH